MALQTPLRTCRRPLRSSHSALAPTHPAAAAAILRMNDMSLGCTLRTAGAPGTATAPTGEAHSGGRLEAERFGTAHWSRCCRYQWLWDGVEGGDHSWTKRLDENFHVVSPPCPPI